MLFKINMYRLAGERRVAAGRRARSLAFLVLIVCLNAIVIGLVAQSVLVTMDSAIGSTESRLRIAQDAMVKVTGNGRSLSEEQRELLRVRIGRTKWSAVLEDLASLVSNDMWLTRLTLVEKRIGSGTSRTSGLHIEGVVRTSRRDDSSESVMAFVQRLRGNEEFSKDFHEVRLSGMDWSSKTDSDLEFEIFCPIENEEE